MGDLQKHDFDEHLGFGTVEVREHLADSLGGGLVRDENHPARLRVNGKVGIPNRGVVWILPRGAAAAGAGAAAAGAAAKTASAKAPPAKTAAASLLGISLKRQAQTEPEEAGEILAPICSLFDHTCFAVSFSQIAVNPGCPHLEADAPTAASR